MIKFNIKIIEPILKLFNNIINKQENILFYDIVGAWRSLSLAVLTLKLLIRDFL